MMEDRDWQRLDKWLWCARVRKSRTDCAAMVTSGQVRINRLPTEKPHAKLRPGDVITLALHNDIKVWRVLGLAARRGPPAEARALYDEIIEAASCATSGSSAYPTQIVSTPGDPR